MSISLKRKKIFQEEKHHSPVFWKAFQINTNYFSLHRHFKSYCLYISRIPPQEGKFRFSFIASKRPFWWTIFINILSKFQRVHIFVKFRKVRNMAQSTKMADGICPKLYIFNTPVQKEGYLPGVHIHTVCNLPFGHSSELKVILK